MHAFSKNSSSCWRKNELMAVFDLHISGGQASTEWFIQLRKEKEITRCQIWRISELSKISQLKRTSWSLIQCAECSLAMSYRKTMASCTTRCSWRTSRLVMLLVSAYRCFEWYWHKQDGFWGVKCLSSSRIKSPSFYLWSESSWPSLVQAHQVMLRYCSWVCNNGHRSHLPWLSTWLAWQLIHRLTKTTEQPPLDSSNVCLLTSKTPIDLKVSRSQEHSEEFCVLSS